SCDYREGFVEGFADYLDFGGTGEPPPVPPPGYRLFGYMTPDGLAAMDEWKRGFRHGSATARASNLRDLVTLPVHWGPVYTTEPPERKPQNQKAAIEQAPPPNLKDQEPEKPMPPPMEPVRPQ